MADSTSPSKPFYKRWWFITLAVIVLIALVMPKAEERATTDTPTSSQTSSAGASDPANAPAAEPEEPASKVTLANFNRVRTGMSDNEVFSILGNGEVLSESGEGEYHTIMYSWKADNGIANMNVMFQGGKVMSKAQLGLE